MFTVNNNKNITNLIIEKSLLGLSVACAVLSVIPPLRTVGTICLRVTSLIMGGTNIATSWKQSSTTEKVILCAKVAMAGAGIAGLLLHSPALLAAALIADMAVNLFEGFKAGMDNRYEDCLKHLLFFKIEALILCGIIIGSTPLLMKAALITAFAMTLLAIYSAIKIYKTKEYHNLFDAIAYGVLAATSVISFNHLRVFNRSRPEPQISGKNDTDKILQIYDKEGHQLGTVKPGESYNFTVKGDTDCLYYKAYPTSGRPLPEAGVWTFKSPDAQFTEAVKMKGLTTPLPGTGLEVVSKPQHRPISHAI